MRCPKGFKQHPPKSGICVKKSETKNRSSTPVLPSSPSTKKNKRCPKGTRKNKSGVCVASVATVGKVKPVAKKPLSVDDAIKKWLYEAGDEDFFSAEEIAEIKTSARKFNLTGQQVYNNLDDFAKGTGILIDY